MANAKEKLKKEVTVSSRFAYVDALRGIAIALVFVVHAGSYSGLRGIAKPFANAGQMGVQLFFVISAFTIFYSLSRRKTDDPHLIGNFFIRRLFRIIPVYWMGIVLYTAVYGLASRSNLPGPEVWHYPFHILLINLFHPEVTSSVVPGGWSISCEVIFYCMVPFLFRLCQTIKGALGFLVFSITVLPLLNLGLQRLLAPYFGDVDSLLLRLFYYRSILNQIGCFAVGFLVFHFTSRVKDSAMFTRKSSNFGLLTVCLFLCLCLVRFQPPFIGTHFLYSILFGVIALCLSVFPWAILVNSFTIFLGRISFSCYLIHFLVLKQVALHLPWMAENHGPGRILNFVVMFLLCLFATIPLAALSYRFVEVPAMALGKSVSRLWLNRPLKA
ncbi:acyltransferase [Roseibacillus persicicus]|uniref:acyltransferase family protein n=1 Tax=Roseibacillus persicicus TaxID=454148 RepID=UPI00398B6991